MYSQNVPEKIIGEKTGHKSLVGLRAYERTSTAQEQNLSKLLTGPKQEDKENIPLEELDTTKERDENQKIVSSFGVDKKVIFNGNLDNCTFNFY